MLALLSSLLIMPYTTMGIAPLVIAAVLGAAMAAKKNSDDRRQAAIDRATQAQVAQYSPWTGMKPEAVQNPGSALGAMAGGAVGGLGVGQMIQGGMNGEASQNAQNNLTNSQADYYKNLNTQNIVNQNKAGSAGAMGGMPAMKMPDYNVQPG